MKFVSLPPHPPPAGFGQRAQSTAASAVEADALAGPHHRLLLADCGMGAAIMPSAYTARGAYEGRELLPP